MNCGCNIFTVSVSGGLVIAPKALIVVEQIQGGATLGGSAFIDLYNDIFDNFSGLWPLSEQGVGDPQEYIDLSRKQLHGSGGSLQPTLSTNVGCLPCQVFAETSLGIGESITLPPDLIPADFSVSMWIQMSRKYAQRTFYSRGSNPYTFQLGYSFLNHIVASLYTDQGFFEVYSDRLELDRNYHIACSYNGSLLNLFIDGELVDSLSVTGTPYEITEDGFFGRLNNAGYPDCKIQEVRLWSFAQDESWFTAERENFCGSLYEVGELETVTS